MKIKRIASALLILLIIFQFVPAQEAIAVYDELPPIPEGYTYYGDCLTDEYGESIYYICKTAGDTGISVGYWIDSLGNRVSENENAEEYIKTTDTENGEAVITLDKDRENSPYPKSYDARDYGYVTAFEYQIGGTCWSMASTAAVESNAIKNGLADNTLDLSEYHAVWNGGNGYFEGVTDSINDGYVSSNPVGLINNGGTPTKMGYAYLNYAGAVTEAHFPLSSVGTSRATIKDATTLVNELTQKNNINTKYLRDITVTDVISVSSNERAIKAALLEYGGLYIAFGSVSAARYLYENGEVKLTTYFTGKTSTSGYHAVELIGWDDDFSLEYFGQAVKPKAKGAWLCKNSYGADWGNMGGYFWLSYEEATMYGVTAFKTASNDQYKDIFYYDGVGYSSTINASKAANIFTAEEDTRIIKVSLGGNTLNTNYTMSIYKLSEGYESPTDGELLYTQSANFSGQKTVDVYGDVYLKADETFSVVFSDLTKCFAEGKSSATRKFTSNLGESFYYLNGEWVDSATVKDNQGNKLYNNICIRAIGSATQEKESYSVEFVCGSKRIQKYSDKGEVELPQEEGYTWIFTYNGKEFDGKGVTSDMVVLAHCYPTDGRVNSKYSCITEYVCKYCSQQVKPAVSVHSMSNQITPPTEDSMGVTKSLCSKCGYSELVSYDAYPGAESGSCGTIHWQYYEGTLAFNGTGDIDPLYNGNASWTAHKNDTDVININNGITEVDVHAFDGFSAIELYLPESVYSVGNYAFSNMTKLKTVDLCDAEYIGDYAFKGDTSLTEITMPTALDDYGLYIFYDCTALNKIVFPEGTNYIYGDLYTVSDSSKWSLKELMIPSTVYSIDAEYIRQFYKIEKVTISPRNDNYRYYDGILYNSAKTKLYSYPANKTGEYFKILDSVTSISGYAFDNNPYLKYLDMNCKTKVLNAYSVYKCKNLAYINLPYGLTTAYAEAVSGCGDIKSLYIPTTATSLDAYWFKPKGAFPKLYTNGESAKLSTYASANNTTLDITHTAHNYSTYLINGAKCDVAANRLSVCDCGCLSYTTGAISHDFSGELKYNGESTHVKKCVFCGDWSSAEACDMVLTESNSGANCVTEGADTYTCSECGGTTEINNGKYGSHSYVNNKCKFCGDVKQTVFTRILAFFKSLFSFLFR